MKRHTLILALALLAFIGICAKKPVGHSLYSASAGFHFAPNAALPSPWPTQTKNLIVITLDGVRWQEVFRGADSLLLSDNQFTPDPTNYFNRYWAGAETERRSRLMPFIWQTVGQQGQLYGNRDKGNFVNVSNGMWFSYPGYNEIFSGAPDDNHIFSNSKVTNPNPTVLEFLNHQDGFRDKVAAFCTWDAFPYILNEKRGKFPVFTGAEIPKMPEAVHADQSTLAAALQYLKNNRPRVMYIACDDTDHYAHEGKYQEYLDAISRSDAFLAELWAFVQEDPGYRNQTTLLVTTDHGRGGEQHKKRWRDHFFLIKGSDAIWFSVIGPDTPATGEMGDKMQLWQKQFAQTFAYFLETPFKSPAETAPPISSVFRQKQ